ncbi:MAG: hypothetical protein M0R75_16035 [Dehalococcoidia bacterium]|nr:hypothetical protein [Dehalococcoidia bacterium]
MADNTLDLVAIQEIAARANVSPDAVHKWRARYSDFPSPAADLAMGAVWRWEDIDAWLIQRGLPRARKPLLDRFGLLALIKEHGMPKVANATSLGDVGWILEEGIPLVDWEARVGRGHIGFIRWSPEGRDTRAEVRRIQDQRRALEIRERELLQPSYHHKKEREEWEDARRRINLLNIELREVGGKDAGRDAAEMLLIVNSDDRATYEQMVAEEDYPVLLVMLSELPEEARPRLQSPKSVNASPTAAPPRKRSSRQRQNRTLNPGEDFELLR